MSLRNKAYSDLMRELWGSTDIWNTKKSYIEIAARLGVDEETVRNRVKHLRDVGFLLGYRLVPNPTLLGRVFASLRIWAASAILSSASLVLSSRRVLTKPCAKSGIAEN